MHSNINGIDWEIKNVFIVIIFHISFYSFYLIYIKRKKNHFYLTKTITKNLNLKKQANHHLDYLKKTWKEQKLCDKDIVSNLSKWQKSLI